MKKRRFAIITRRLPPATCGIGDYSVRFANTLRMLGYRVDLISLEDDMDSKLNSPNLLSYSLSRVSSLLVRLDPSHVLLQFTPQLYLKGAELELLSLTRFWAGCRKKWHCSLIVHETYFLEWWYPPSWIRGRKERQLLRSLASLSDQVFSASHPLVEEIRGWDQASRVSVLPIGSNIEVLAKNKDEIRARKGFEPENVVIVLFGGGNSLRWLASHVNATDRLLRRKGTKLHWVMLGGVSIGWFNLESPHISPGHITEFEVSEWLIAADVFILPHYAGLSAKRGTLMAALAHRLPVVGTETRMTDKFWRDVRGIQLVPRWPAGRFATAVMTVISDRNKAVKSGELNGLYFDNNLSWEVIAKKFLSAVGDA